MKAKQVELIRETWKIVEPIGDVAARLFYERLFEIDPTTRPLFAGKDMERQYTKLIDALDVVVEFAANRRRRLADLAQRPLTAVHGYWLW